MYTVAAGDNRAIIADLNGIRPLVGLLQSRDHRVQEGAARALLNVIAGHDEYTRKVVETNNGVGAVVGLLRSEQLTVRRLGTMMLSMINHFEKGDELIVREGGAKLLVKELLDNGKPLPELKAICGLCHHNPAASHAVADAVQQHHAFTEHTTEHTPCLLRLLGLLELTPNNGPSVNEWATHVLYNMAENSPDLALRLSAAGAEDGLRELRTSGSERARMWAEHTLGVIGAAVAKAGVRKAAADSGSKGKLHKLTAGMDAMIAERDACKAELEQYRSLCATPRMLQQLLAELDEYRRGGTPAASPGGDLSAAATMMTPPSAAGSAAVVPALPLGSPVSMPGLGNMIPPAAGTPPVTPRDALTQTMEILDNLAPRVERLRAVADSGEPVDVVDEMVQLVLTDLDEGYTTIERLERGIRQAPTTDAVETAAFLAQLAGAREGVKSLRDEVAELASVTEDAVDDENSEDNMAILELAEMLQGLMQAAKLQNGGQPAVMAGLV